MNIRQFNQVLLLLIVIFSLKTTSLYAFDVELKSNTPTRFIQSAGHIFGNPNGVDRAMRFDVEITSSRYEILSVDLEKSIVNGIYPKVRVVNGKFMDIQPTADSLESLKYMHYNNRIFSGLSLKKKKNIASLHFTERHLEVTDVFKYDVDATVYLKVLDKQQPLKFRNIEDVIIKDKDNSYIRTKDGEVIFSMMPAGSSTTLNGKTFYDFKLYSKDAVDTVMSIVDGSKEIMLDNSVFGGVLKRGTFDPTGKLVVSSNLAYFPEAYFGRPISIKLYYREAIEYPLKVQKSFQTNVVDFL